MTYPVCLTCRLVNLLQSMQCDYDIHQMDVNGGASPGMTCPVCLKRLKSQKCHELGKPRSCDHFFCFSCIFEWSKVSGYCMSMFEVNVEPPMKDTLKEDKPGQNNLQTRTTTL